MKRTQFIKYLTKNSCILVREGSKHSIFKNNKNGKMSTIPRHSEIKEELCRKICKDLDIDMIP